MHVKIKNNQNKRKVNQYEKKNYSLRIQKGRKKIVI